MFSVAIGLSWLLKTRHKTTKQKHCEQPGGWVGVVTVPIQEQGLVGDSDDGEMAVKG